LISTNTDSVVIGLRLRTVLRKARDEANLTQDRVGAQLRWSAKKVYRIETGESPVTDRDAQSLAALYGMNPARTQELLDLVAAASGSAWWTPYRRVVPPEFGLFLSCERAAIHLHSFHPTLVHGLVQTERYARAILSATSTPLDLQQRVKLRRERRNVLDRQDPPDVTVLLGEAALHNRVGTPEVMHEQLLELRSLATAGLINLGVVPFEDCVYPAMLIAFDLAHLSDQETSLHLELPPISRTTKDETALNDLYGDFFTQIRSRAQFGSDAAALINAALAERSRGDSDDPR
jgi:transcriptional regulator with XRE-family HTH domain